jgi:hypothetical protein
MSTFKIATKFVNRNQRPVVKEYWVEIEVYSGWERWWETLAILESKEKALEALSALMDFKEANPLAKREEIHAMLIPLVGYANIAA